jgi:hypothetical protein
MATWELTTEWKKSSVERQFWFKGDKCIIREEGYRWGTFTVESDVRPLTDEELKNDNGYELGSIDNGENWEMQDLTDGCWGEIECGNNATQQDIDAFTEAWDRDWYSGVEELGWSLDDTEFYFQPGPLKLTNLDTGVEYSGSVDPETVAHTIELPAAAPTTAPEPLLTDWYPATINPVHKGTYQVIDTEETKWPFGSNIIAGTWDGKKWDVSVNVVKWRGLANKPN